MVENEQQLNAQAVPDTPILVSDLKTLRETAGHLAAGFEGLSRAFVQVQHGCDNACSFCAVPAERGSNRSVPVQQIVDQVQALVGGGRAEVVLVGANIAGYGTDLDLCDENGTGLSHLIRAILDAVPALQRLRLGTLDPARLDQGFFDLLAREPRLMGHLHLSLQAADDDVLQAMGRRHAVADVEALMAEARNARPAVVFGADVIAGFPGETDAMFDATMAAVTRWNITYLNVFPYSARSDVAAANLVPVSGDVVQDRARRLREVADAALERHLNSLTGSVHAILMENENFGRSESFAPVRLANPVGFGQTVQVALTTLKDGELLGAARGDFKTTDGDNAGGWLKKMKSGLGKSSERITSGIGQVFTVRRRLDDEALEALEEVLITADIGVSTATKLTASLAKTRFDQEIGDVEVRETFAAEIAKILQPVAKPLEINPILKPHVVLVCGVNGSGKTTTIGKLAKQFVDEGQSVMLAAGDTFRAAAIEQLQVWGERAGVPVIAREIGSDSAGLAYDALEQARAQNVDVLLIDTAGRLQNKTHLMEELEKVVRVIKKIDDTAPHDVVLVLDATVGQNAHAQVNVFKESVHVSGLVMTKLDGTAKGGVVVALADKFALPVHAIGVGEGAEDLRPFDAQDFARNLMGLD